MPTTYKTKKTYDANNLSLRDALEITELMWNWLAENPTSSKFNALKVLEIPDLNNQCACCHYTQKNRGLNPICSNCPLKSFWGDIEFACDKLNKPFRNWREAHYTDKPQFALQIASAARAELDKLDEAERKAAKTVGEIKESPQCTKSFEYSKTEPPKAQHPYAEWQKLYEQGVELEVQATGMNWISCKTEPVKWNIYENRQFRIKPKPTYRPWRAEELTTKVGCIMRHKTERFGDAPVTMLLSVRGIWAHFICAVTAKQIDIAPNTLFEEYEHSTDGGKSYQPCGVLVEEGK